MSEEQQSEAQAQEDASVVTMALAGCSIIWMLAASLLAAFLVALGTLACGNMCAELSMIWVVTGVILLCVIGFCLWVFIAMLRKRLSSGLVAAMLGLDIALFAGLVVMGGWLGGY